MSKNALFLHVENMEKLMQYPVPETDQSQKTKRFVPGSYPTYLPRFVKIGSQLFQ